MTGSGDFSIGSNVWPGTSKLMEEMGELQQVLGKLIAVHGRTEHWSGDLRSKLIEELGDVLAAIEFFNTANMTHEERQYIHNRATEKLALFRRWHAEQPEVRDIGPTHDLAEARGQLAKAEKRLLRVAAIVEGYWPKATTPIEHGAATALRQALHDNAPAIDAKESGDG
jgi:NTP pyrophosphatase (non-canonical NTP hydrolase)